MDQLYPAKHSEVVLDDSRGGGVRERRTQII
jgi:hypothetical protein